MPDLVCGGIADGRTRQAVSARFKEVLAKIHS
jgi:hypothetical protein